MDTEKYCRICGGEDLEVWDIRDTPYFHCPACGFVQIDPKHFPSDNLEKKRYLEHNNEAENRGYISYLESFLSSSFHPFVKRGGRVLDFGSGPVPVLGKILKKSGYSVDIYDPFFAPSNFWQRNKYDAVTAVEVFEHLINPAAETERILKVLKKGGYLVIRTMLHNGVKSDFSSWWYPRDFTHISFYTEKTIEFIAEKYNLELIAVKRNCEIVFGKK